MTFTLYHATVPTWRQLLPQTANLIDKAEAWCRAEGMPESELIQARLAPDMWDFGTQLRMTCVHSALALEGALTGDFAPASVEPPADFPGLRAMVADARARIDAVTPAQIDALVGRETVFRLGETRRMAFATEDFLTSFVLPNFQFHLSMAYAILRMKGVAVGKQDYLGQLRLSVPAA